MKRKSKDYQKFIGASISAAVVASTAAPAMVPAAQVNGQSFPDIQPAHFSYDAVNSLTNRNVINGYEDGSFRPDQTVTRAEAAKILSLTLGLEATNVQNQGFADVKTSDWYYGYVSALAEAGIIHGYEDKTFRPNEILTRAQMAKIITVAFTLEATSTNKFSDVKDEDWFASYVGPLVEKEITVGTTPTTFSPYQETTRGQIAAFIYRAEQAKNPESTIYKIDSVTDSAIVINNVSYNIDDNVKAILHSANAPILKNAIIQFDHTDNVITKIKSLEITTSGKSTEEQLVLNGNNGSVEGDLKVNADYVSLQNVTVKGKLELNDQVESNFYGKNVTIEGKTIVSAEEAKQSVNISSLFVQQAATEENNISVTFEDSSIGTLKVKKGTSLTLKGNTTIKELVVEDANTKITVGTNSKITNITLPTGVKIEDVVENYQSVKSKIEKVDGKSTSSPSSSGGNSGGGNTTKQAPSVAADTTDLEIGNDIELPFTDNETWRNNVTAVELDGTVVDASKYTIMAGKITLDKSLFTEEKSYSIVIKANGYHNVTISQTIQLPALLDEIPSEITTAGTYGSETGVQTIEGNLIVKSSDVTLRNLVINGDLIIDEAVGDGEVYLEGVNVQGTTTVNGGGENSIYFTDSVLVTVIVNKNDGRIRIVAQGNSRVEDLQLESYVRIEEQNLTGDSPGFTDVTLGEGIQNVSPELQVQLEGAFETINSRAANVRIQLGEETSIEDLVVSAIAAISGGGVIHTAQINADQVVLEQRPSNLVLQIPNGGTTQIGGETYDESYSESDTATLTSIKATQGMIDLEFDQFAANINANDFDVTAAIDGESISLSGLSYSASEGKFFYDPVSLEGNIGKTLTITVTPKGQTVTGEPKTSGLQIDTGFQGRITDIHGVGMANVKINFREGLAQSGDIIKEVTTDQYGYYSINLPAGAYTGELVGEEIITSYLYGVAPSHSFGTNQNETAIRAAASTELKIMLSWGESPFDVDSHLFGPKVGSPDQFHTYFGDNTYQMDNIIYADLDWDDTQSFGPETTTIRQLIDGTYTFIVHNWSGSPELRTSNAKVEIFIGRSQVANQTFTVPTGEGNELYWKVFNLIVSNNGQDVEIVPINTMYEFEPEEFLQGNETEIRSELQSLINYVTSLLSSAQEGTEVGNYQPGAKASLQAELDQALVVLNNEASSAVELFNAINRLETAFNDFVRLEVVDGTELREQFAEFESVYENAVEGNDLGEYEEGSKLIFKEELNRIGVVASKETLTNQELADALEDLYHAYYEFQSGQLINPSDYTKLSDLIAWAQVLLEDAEEGTELGQYPTDALNTFSQEINAATLLMDQSSVRLREVTQAIQQLDNAIGNFQESQIGYNEIPYYLTELSDLIFSAEQLIYSEEAQYLPEEAEALQQAVNEARSIYTWPIDLQDLSAKINGLESAIQAFEESEVVLPEAPDVSTDDENNTIIGMDTTMEYKVDNGEYIQYDGTSAPELSGNHTVLVRTSATESSPAGAEITLTFTENPTVPTAEELQVLTDAVVAAQVKSESAVAGSEPGQYPQSAIDAFLTAIVTADTVAKKSIVTKEEIDKAISDLATAESTFDEAKIPVSATTNTSDTANDATFTGAIYNVDTNTFELSGLTHVETDSTFNLNTLTCSAGEETSSTATLAGDYTFVASLEEVDQAGEYFYDAATSTLTVILIDEDAQAIETLSDFGTNGSIPDTLTALEGWNTDLANNKAAFVSIGLQSSVTIQ